ncbi:MAG: hypothetical protein QG570_143 [Patescibacteria group bacterium]|nr:hypothetical protein [Patescibacteria group bacterium]
MKEQKKSAMKLLNIFKKRKVLLSLLTVFVVIFLILFLYVFRVGSLEVVSNSDVADSDFITAKEALQNEYIGQSMFFVDNIDVSAYLASFVFSHKLSHIVKTYPSHISVVVEPRKPKYLVKAPNGLFNLDSDYYVIESTEDQTGIIQIEYQSDLLVRRHIEDKKLIAGLKYSTLDAKVIVGNEISITFEDGSKVILPEEQDAEQILDILKKIRQKYTIENRAIELIDLRYSKPIIKFK